MRERWGDPLAGVGLLVLSTRTEQRNRKSKRASPLPLPPASMQFLSEQGGQSHFYDSETLDMTVYGLGEIFEGNFANMCAKKFC